MSSISNWYINSDNVIQLSVFLDVLAGTYLNSATVTATMKNTSGEEVTGETLPVTLTYVTDSNGVYRATVDKDLVLSEGNIYFIEYTAVQGEINKFFRKKVKAVYDE